VEIVMLDHVGLRINDYKLSKAFYEKALAVLGFEVIMEITPEMTGGDAHCGFGKKGGDNIPFWIGTSRPLSGQVHIAFVAKDRAAVEAFYHAALAAGGKDNGPPGPRPIYHPGYYGAFVLDPDGNNVEAVCHKA
jgi:catechol 2,3-dioxygenase-like lactoylglutathione lyase family enzyme